jgi:hypothetical protein
MAFSFSLLAHTPAAEMPGLCTGQRLENQRIVWHMSHSELPVHHLIRPSACGATCPRYPSPHLSGFRRGNPT